MTMNSWYETAKELEARGESFVLATVIRAVAPTSAKSGDKALISEDGVVHGWVGGSCAEPTVKKEAALALADGAGRVVQITPEAGFASEREGLVVVPMTCYSGGELEIYLEPHRARAEMVVFGNSPVAQTLVELGSLMGYQVSVADTTDRPAMNGVHVIRALEEVELKRPDRAAVVVATHGVFDEDAIVRAVSLEPRYLGVVASVKRFASLRSSVLKRGVSPEAWDRIDGPAGIDIGARTPEEIAVSIMSGITAERESIAVTTLRPSRGSEPGVAEAGVAGGIPASSDGSCCGGGSD
jgi:xanthine dehydrogenase accessory factor